METSKTIGEQTETARQLEKSGRLSEAAAIYQKLFKKDPTEQQVIERLLILYRKLKDYNKELSVLNECIAALQRHQKAAQKKWIQTHPNAASAGKLMLRQLAKGGNVMMGLGDNSLMERWIKRKDLVTGKISGKKGKRHAKKAIPKVTEAAEKQRQWKIAEINRKKIAKERKERQRQAALAATKAKESEEKKPRAARQQAEAAAKKVEPARHLSLFVVILHYVAPLGEIDKMMKQHISFLNKHFKNREFILSGRLVPRTGGLILARAKDRNAVEKTIKQDPFIKRKLASADIIEFSARQIGQGLERWLK